MNNLHPLDDIADRARLLAHYAPSSAEGRRKALEGIAIWRNVLQDNERPSDHEAAERYLRDDRHTYNCYDANCRDARILMNELAALVYKHLPDLTLRYVRINPQWRFDDAKTDWEAITAELRMIEDTAYRKGLAVETAKPEPESETPKSPGNKGRKQKPDQQERKSRDPNKTPAEWDLLLTEYESELADDPGMNESKFAKRKGIRVRTTLVKGLAGARERREKAAAALKAREAQKRR